MKTSFVSNTGRLLWSFFGFAWLRLLFLTLASFVSATMEITVLWCLIALVVKVINGADGVSSAKGPGLGASTHLSISTLLLFGVSSILVRVALDLYRNFCLANVVADFEGSRRDAIFTAYLHSSYERQNNERAGHLQTLISQHLEMARYSLQSLATGLSSCGTLAIFAVAAFFINGLAVILLLVLLVGLFVCLRPVSLLVRQLGRQFGNTYVTFNNTLNQGIAVSRELRVFNVSERFLEHLKLDSLQLHRFRRLSSFFGALVPTMYQNTALLLLMGSIAAIYYGGLGDLASLGLVILLLIRGYSYGQVLQSIYHSTQECVPYLEQLAAAEKDLARSEVKDAGGILPPIRSIQYEHVTFTYPGEHVGLQDVSFSLVHGEVLAVVGPSGSGKSTLMQLLLRLRTPGSGSITVNGSSIEDFSLHSWYRRVSFVPQEPHLFDASIKEAIRFFRPEVSDEAIERSARLVGIEDEILAFPRGFDTRVGEGGANLSGGQRQRLCLARALAGDPDLLVLDEPTSALDSHSEAMILEGLAQCKGRITTVIIGHRLAMLNICDRVLVLQRGSVHAVGLPSELVLSSSYFRDAVRPFANGAGHPHIVSAAD